MSDKRVVQTCYHCGNRVFIQDHGEIHNNYAEVYGYSEEGGPDFVLSIYESIIVKKCSICSQLIVYREYYDSEDVKQVEDIPGFNIEEAFREVIYPNLYFKDKHKIPKNVLSAYESAIKVQNIDGIICLISLRRTLEILCKEQGETKGNLNKKLQNLVDKKVIPPVIEGVTTLLRKAGNAAAHGDDVEFPQYLVKEMIEYTQIILDYVYILPSKIQQSEARIIEKLEKND